VVVSGAAAGAMGRESPRVALVTCAEFPAADPETRGLIEPLASLGVAAEVAVWDDPAVDWSAFDLAVVRSCWDYAGRRDEFLAWARRVPPLANPGAVIAWNTDKRYLAELAARGIGVVPTAWVEPSAAWRPPSPDDSPPGLWVVKPAVSLCALDSGRYDLRDPAERRLAEQHVRRLQGGGRVAMVQPYLTRVDEEGETSLVFIAGRYSHAVRRRAVLDGPDRGIDRRFTPDGGLAPRPAAPTRAQREVAERALDAVPRGRGRLLYARVDLVPDDDGAPLVMEVELTEPHLYLGLAPGAPARFAAAIAARAASAPRAGRAGRAAAPVPGPDAA
jgi:hypothetical protein